MCKKNPFKKEGYHISKVVLYNNHLRVSSGESTTNRTSTSQLHYTTFVAALAGHHISVSKTGLTVLHN